MISDRLKELIKNAVDNQYITYSDYLTPNEYLLIGDKYQDLKVFKSGKLRKMLAFVPEYQEEYINFPEELIKIEVNNKFIKYSNKDFLGAIMSLNIDRKYIGDLFVNDNICYVYVSSKILNIVLQLDKVSRNSCVINLLDEKLDLDFNFENINFTISSIRLDSIVSKIINKSREKAKEYISLGYVSVDYNLELNFSRELKNGSILSIKSYGRYIYSGIVKETKKGKLIIEIKKYI